MMTIVCCITLTAVESTVALIISIGTAIFTLIKYYRFEKRISKQEIALNDIHLAEAKRNEENQRKADIQLSFASFYNSSKKLKVYNKGFATAESVEVKFLDDISLLGLQKRTLTINRLEHLQNKDYDVHLINGHPDEIRAQISWKDDYCQNNTKTVTVFIQ